MAAPRMRVETGENPSTEVEAPEVAATQQETPAPAAPESEPVPVKETSAPVFVVEEAPEPEPEPERPVVEKSPAAVAQGSASEIHEESKKRSLPNMGEWVHNTFPGHEGAFWGAVLALLVALLVFWIGFFRVLFILILVVIGVAVGQFIDGDPKIIRAVRKLFVRDREEW